MDILAGFMVDESQKRSLLVGNNSFLVGTRNFIVGEVILIFVLIRKWRDLYERSKYSRLRKNKLGLKAAIGWVVWAKFDRFT